MEFFGWHLWGPMDITIEELSDSYGSTMAYSLSWALWEHSKGYVINMVQCECVSWLKGKPTLH